MKLVLTSNGGFLIKEGYKLLGIPVEQIKIGYIVTGAKTARDQSFFVRHKEAMHQEGYAFTEFDIEGKTQQEILDFFADKNVIHVEGGNSFYLLKVIRETNFAEILKILLGRGLFYVGSSAGAYIMCPTVEVSDWDITGKDRFGMKDFTALNYVPFLIKAHYTDDEEPMVREKMKTLKYPLRILRDGQGILVEDGKYSFKGEGNEVQLS